MLVSISYLRSGNSDPITACYECTEIYLGKGLQLHSTEHTLHVEGPRLNFWILQAGLEKTFAGNPGKLLPFSVDGSEQYGPMV